MMECETCGKDFENENALRMHQRWHNDAFREKKTNAAKQINRLPKTKKYKSRKQYVLPVEEEMIKDAKKRAHQTHTHVSDCLKQLIAEEQNGGSEKNKIIKSGDVGGFIEYIENQKIEDGTYRPIQITGLPGSGKSTTIKELIQQTDGVNGRFKYCVIDFHNEYDFLPRKERIPEKFTKSFRIVPADNMLVLDTMFEAVHTSHILSKKWANNIIFVLDEAQRLKTQAKFLLKEARKRCILIVVSPSPIIDEFPSIKVTR